MQKEWAAGRIKSLTAVVPAGEDHQVAGPKFSSSLRDVFHNITHSNLRTLWIQLAHLVI